MKTKITKLIVLLVIALFQFTDIFGQCPTQIIGNGSTSANGRAPNARFRNGRGVYLISAAEMTASGYLSGNVVTGIGWLNTVAPGVTAAGTLTLYMQNTSDAAYNKGTNFATAITGMTTVHNGSYTIPNTLAENLTNFTGGTSFTYTGGGLYIAFDWTYCAGTLSTAQTLSCSNALVGGANGLNSLQNGAACATLTTLAGSAFRPDTRLYTTCIANDAKVDVLYSFGKLATTHSTNHAVRANIKNLGTNALSGLVVSLSITGANTFSNNQTIASLAPGASSIVTFAGFTPTVVGTNTVTVSVPNDDNNSNNSKSLTQTITPNQIVYKDPSQINDGGAGFTGGTGAFVGKFFSATGGQINEVKVDFFGAGATYRLGIYADNAGVPSLTPLYTDATDRTATAGSNTLTLGNLVTVAAGNFYVGVRQTGTANANFAYSNENPIRAGNFFYTSPLPETNAWTEFGAAVLPFRMNIEVQFFNPCAGSPAVGNCTSSVSSICTGGTTLTLTGIGAESGLTYQWQQSINTGAYTNISGANGDTYIYPSFTVGGSYTFRCVVTCSNSGQSTPSNPTTAVTVFEPASINPASIGLCAGGSAVATALPAGATSYLWATGGETTQTKTITTAGTYTVTVTQGSCVTTASATATVIANPTLNSITASPASICSGNNSSLNASVSLPATPSYCQPATTNGGSSADEISLFQSAALGYNYSFAGMTAAPGYINQTGTVGNGVAGTVYSITVNQQDANDAFRIWIDMNDNGSFEDAGELLWTSGPATSQVANITIPAATSNGTHRLRIRNAYTLTNAIAATLSCTSGNTYGVTIDFSLAVTGGVAPLTYVWSPATFLSSTSIPNPVATAMTGTTTYNLTATAFTGCVVSGNTTVTVNQNPTVSAGPAMSAICQGGTTGPLGGSVGGGATGGTWSDGGIGGVFIPNANNLNATYTATSNAPASITFTLTSSGGSCGVVAATKTMTVNPTPVGSTSNASMCSGSTTNVVLNSTLGGTTFNWSGANFSGVSTGFGSGTSSVIANTLINTSNSTASIVRYTITPTSSAGCAGANFLSDITVNPTPVGSTTGDEVLCSGDMTSGGLSTGTGGTSTFTWTASGSSGNVSGYSNCSSACGNMISQTLSNTGNNDETVVYTITPTSAAGCVGSTFILTETVGATPVASASNTTICSSTPANVGITSSVAGTDFTWTATLLSGSATGFSNCPGGCGTSINDVLNNTGTNNAVVEYTISATSVNGCPGADVVVDVTISPALSITLPANITTANDAGLCSANVSYTTSTTGATSVSYTFSGATTGSGSGDGSGSSFNGGTTTVTITATSSCQTGSASFDITVNDTENPVISTPATDMTVVTDGAGNTAAFNQWLIADWGNADATDNCSSQLTLDGNWHNDYSPLNWVTDCGSAQHVYVGFYTVDGSGNWSPWTYATFYIIDNVAPTISVPPTANITTDAGLCTSSASIGTTTGTDVGSSVTITNNNQGPYSLGSNTVIWTATDACGNMTTGSQIVNVTDTQVPTITAPADVSVCSGGAVNLGNATASDNCTFTVTNNAPGTFPNGTTVVTWTVTDGSGNTATANQNVTVNVGPVGSASNITICNGDPSNVPLNSNIAGSSFTWTSAVITGGVVGNGNCTGGCSSTITDVLTNTLAVHGVVEYTVTPTSPAGCVGNAFTVQVTVGAAPAMPVISGPSVVCLLTTATYSCPAVAEATNYTWTVPTGVTGMTITSGQGTTSINVTISAGTVTGNVTCTASNNCGNSPTASMAVTKKPATPGAISGPTSTCGQSTATYFIGSVFGASSYSWTVPAGMTITSGQGTTQINVSIATSFVSGLVKVSAVNPCGSVAANNLQVYGNVPAAPVSISGPAAVCGLTTATYSIAPVSGATGYQWSITGAGTIQGSNTGTSVTVALTGTSSGVISCSATNVCGTGIARTLNLTTTPAQPGVITGPTVVCTVLQATYSVPNTGGTYNWTFPGTLGSIFSGQGTSSIVLQFTAALANAVTGVLAVTNTTQCGTSAPRNLIIAQTAPPATPSGPTNVTGMTTATYSIPVIANAIDYVWTTTSTGGQIKIFNQQLGAFMPPPYTTSGNSENTITVQFTGVGVCNTCTGNIKVAAQYSCVDRATNTSTYKTLPVTGVALGPNAMNEYRTFSEIHPNPASTEFSIDINSDYDGEVIVEVFDVLGKQVIEQKRSVTAGETSLITNVEGLEKGMYFVRIVDNNNNLLYSQRVVKQ